MPISAVGRARDAAASCKAGEWVKVDQPARNVNATDHPCSATPVTVGAECSPRVDCDTLMNSIGVRGGLLLLAAFAALVVVFARPPVPQPSAYHLMADQRAIGGIPHFFNVVSNLPFLIVGMLGLSTVLGRHAHDAPAFADRWERWPYVALFVGVGLTSVGSTYYHLAPDNARLVWDRLPMTIGFMGLLTAMLAERVSLKLAQWLFAPLL